MLASSSPNRRLIVMLAAFLALALAALACTPNVTTQVTSAPVATVATTSPTEPPATSAPTEAPATEAPATQTAEATAPSGGEITANNAKDLKELQNITVSTAPVLAVAVSGASHEVATLGADRTLRLWDGDTGNKLKEMPKFVDHGWALAFSHDGKSLASGTGFTLTIWDPTTGNKSKPITTNAAIYRLAYSPDGAFLAVAGEFRSKLDIINVNNGAVVSTLASPPGYDVWSASYSADGSKLALADSVGNFTVFDAKSKAELGSASAAGAAWDVEFSPDGKYVTTCNTNGDLGGINTWDSSNFSIYSKLTLPEIHGGGCKDGVYSKSGDVFFSVGADGIINAWDFATGNLLFHKEYGFQIYSVGISGDGQIVALVLDNGTMHILGLK